MQAGIRSISVMLHGRHPDALRMRYRVWTLAEDWSSEGRTISPAVGPGPVEADVIFPHLDVSFVPDPYWGTIERAPRVINGRVRDIRKRAYSTLLVRRDDPWDGPVIVKTNNNCGGNFDDWLEGRGRPDNLLKRALWRFSRLRWVERRRLGRVTSLCEYHLFDSARHVPRGAFGNPGVVVERFLPEREGDRNILRSWWFLGEYGTGWCLVSPERIIKGRNARTVPCPEPPPEVVAIRSRLCVDYAKVDYVVHAGVGVVFDVNLTPTWTDPPTPQRRDSARFIASGLESAAAGLGRSSVGHYRSIAPAP